MVDAQVVIIEDNVVEECVEVGSSSSSDYSPARLHWSRHDSDDSDSRPGSPYSSISHSTVYSISSDTSEASGSKWSQSRSVSVSQPRREASRLSRSPAATRKQPSSYRGDGSPLRRPQSKESDSLRRSRHESSPYSGTENRSYGSSVAKGRPIAAADSRAYQHESSKQWEASPSTSEGRRSQRGYR